MLVYWINLAAVAGLLAQAPVVEKTVIKVTTDKTEAIYQKGGEIQFNVLLTEEDKPLAGKTLTYTITSDGGAPQSGKIETKETPVVVQSRLDHPGFVLCTVVYEKEGGKKIKGLGGAGVDPLQIKVSRPAPEDFDKFWQGRKDELAKVPMNPKLVPAPVSESMKGKVECFDLKVDCAGGMPMSGYFARPVNAAKGSLPIIISYHGAGVRSAHMPVGHAAKGMLALDINAHGIENGQPKSFYDELTGGKLKGYPYFDANDKDKIYFNGMFLRVLRSLEFMKSQPEWDGRTLIVTGGSQGGAQSLVAAGLEPKATMCVAYVPAMCDHTGILAGQTSGWPRFIKLKDGKPENEDIVRTVPYFDAANFATRIKAETFIAVGFIDVACPPTSVYAAYNNLNCKKEIINNPLNGHSCPKENSVYINGKITEHIGKMKAGAAVQGK